MMLARPNRRRGGPRRGVAALEFAVVLPVLMFLFMIAIDFGRVFYYSTTLANCARNGAYYESDRYVKRESPYKTVTEAALADAPNLMGDSANLPAVSSTTWTDANGIEYVQVTVGYKFKTVSGFAFIPSEVDLARTVRMARAPLTPGDS